MAIDSKELMDEFIGMQQERHENPDKHRGWRTGIADFDSQFGGIQRGWYFVVAGKRKAGKTAMLTTMKRELGFQGVKFLSVSLEESNLQIAERQVSLQSGVDRNRFRDIALTPEDWKVVYQSANEIRQFNGWWSYGDDTVSTISNLVQELAVDVVLVDYVQLMRSPGASNKVQEVGNISRDLKLLTLREVPLTVIAAAQLNDEGEYLWSRDLGRDADIAVKLTRLDDQYGHLIENKIHCEIADSRHSGWAEFDLMFNGARSLVGSFEKVSLDDKITRKAGDKTNEFAFTL